MKRVIQKQLLNALVFYRKLARPQPKSRMLTINIPAPIVQGHGLHEGQELAIASMDRLELIRTLEACQAGFYIIITNNDLAKIAEQVNTH